MDDILCWRTTLIAIVEDLQRQFDLPFAWTFLSPCADRREGQPINRPVWSIFSSTIYAEFYRTLSLKQSQWLECPETHIAARSNLSCLTILEKLYLDYFGRHPCGGTSILDKTPALNAEQVTVWSLFLVLYTVGALGFLVESSIDSERVQAIADTIWPYVRRVALGDADHVQ